MQISTNWVITSPGRTGSRFISDVLTIFYKETFGVDSIYKGPGTEFDPKGHWQMFHTHEPTQMRAHAQHARSIVSIRNMVESALSYCVVDRTKIYHIFSNTSIGEIPRIQPFHLPLNEFMEQYAYQVAYYRQVKELIQPDTVIIRYNSIMEDWRCVLWDVGFSPADITEEIVNKVEKQAPLKNHWDSRHWISNWDEIEHCARTLPSNPESFFNQPKKLEQKETKNE